MRVLQGNRKELEVLPQVQIMAFNGYGVTAPPPLTCCVWIILHSRLAAWGFPFLCQHRTRREDRQVHRRLGRSRCCPEQGRNTPSYSRPHSAIAHSPYRFVKMVVSCNFLQRSGR